MTRCYFPKQRKILEVFLKMFNLMENNNYYDVPKFIPKGDLPYQSRTPYS